MTAVKKEAATVTTVTVVLTLLALSRGHEHPTHQLLRLDITIYNNGSESVLIEEGVTVHLELFVRCNCSIDDHMVDHDLIIHSHILNTEVAAITNSTELVLSKDNQWEGSMIIDLTAIFIGKTELIVEDFHDMVLPTQVTRILVARAWRPVDTAFLAVVTVMVLVFEVAFACGLDMAVVRHHSLRPVGILIGLLCQCAIMPVVAFGIAHAFHFDSHFAFGLFAFGCSPGGGASNIWTSLLQGDTDLSITMTFVNTLASIVMMPLWLFTLGRHILHGDVVLPWENAFAALASYIGACTAGLLIKRFLPRVASVLKRSTKLLGLVTVAVIIILGTYSNLYIFKLMSSWQVLVAACAIPWIGFFISSLLAVMCRQPIQNVTTIAIETGIQNTGIAIMILKYSLPQPDADLSAVCPIAASMLTPLPLIAALVINLLRQRFSDTVPLDDREACQTCLDSLTRCLGDCKLCDVTSDGHLEAKRVLAKEADGISADGANKQNCGSDSQSKGGIYNTGYYINEADYITKF